MAVGFSDDRLMVGYLTGPTACHTQGPGGGGGGLTKICTGNLPPKVQPLDALVYTSHKMHLLGPLGLSQTEMTDFRSPPPPQFQLEKGTPFGEGASPYRQL